MKKSLHLTNTVILIFILSIVLLSSLFVLIQISTFNSRTAKQAELIQNNYNWNQRNSIQREVEWVSDYIGSSLSRLDVTVAGEVKERTLEAWSIADSLYGKYHGVLTEEQIAEMIKDALRPVRFAGGLGYYFITSYSGTEILFSDRPELEGRNLLDMKTADGKYVIRDMISISRDSGEGLYEYGWTKPGSEGDNHRKISYIKLFEPFDWIIGTGLYMEDEEAAESIDLLEYISRIRFGEEGYIFVNTFDGDALVSSGELVEGNKKLWEVFSSNPEKTKELFRKELDAAMVPGGDFIHYSMRKLGDSPEESPKISYILGIPRLNWLVGSGVYLDDSAEDLAGLRDISFRELHGDILQTVGLVLVLIALFSLFFVFLSRELKGDFRAFSLFFGNSADEEARIDISRLRFLELKTLAEEANRMQTEKVRTQEQLKDSEYRFRLLAENSRDMIFKMSFPEGKYDYVSPASLEVTGYTPEEIMAEPYIIRKVIHPDWEEWLGKNLEAVNRGEIDDTFEYQIIHKNGEERWLNQRNSLIRGEGDVTYILIGRISDETRRKKAEEELNRSSRMDAIGKLASGVAHDFNNVLAGIMNAANVLKSPRRQIDEKGRNMADLILQAASRAADLIARLSAFGGKKTVQLRPVDVHHIITETEIILRRTIDRQIDILLDLKADKYYVIGDGTELQGIILNLVINGSHAIEGHGAITISTENREMSRSDCDQSSFPCKPGTYLRLEVRDTGQGIPPHVLDRIFEPFFTTKEKGKGSGLGLSMVYRSVLDHKGSISVESEVGEGTSFVILLPCSDRIPEKKKAEKEIPGGSGTILLADDEEIIRVSGMHMLEELGYTIVTAANGKEAVEIFSNSPDSFDLVILDVVMPVMSGLDAFFEIRKIRGSCPIVMISGYTKEEDLGPLHAAGLETLVKKPFEEKELNRVIQEILDRRAN